MAAFLDEGLRIPRRGEIGLEMGDVEKFEQYGYVMSGSRNETMSADGVAAAVSLTPPDAVRLRKENQVISAEEKRGLLALQAELKARREAQLVADFRECACSRLYALLMLAVVEQNLAGSYKPTAQ